MTKCNIGDLQSTAKGSAARANEGKLPWSYMPLNQIEVLMRRVHMKIGDRRLDIPGMTRFLSEFQAQGSLDTAYDLLVAAYQWYMEPRDLSFEEASASVIRVWQHGEKKYAKYNWMKGMPWSEVINSAQRHIMAIYNGNELDPETGEPHEAHLICNAMMLVHYCIFYPEGNDLPVEYFQ